MRSYPWRLQGVRFVAASLAILSATIASGQQERPRAVEREGQPAEQRATDRARTHASAADQQIAQCLAISNAEEIALGKMAASKTQNAQVKQFAETISQDHAKFADKLQQFGAHRVELGRGGEVARGQRPERAEPAAPAIAENRRDGVAERRTADDRGGLNFLQIKQEMAEKCLASAQKELSEAKSPQEADMCFMGTQVVLHQQMLDGLQVFKRHASPELQAVLDQGITTTQAHLDQAKQIVQELAQAGRSAPAERTSN